MLRGELKLLEFTEEIYKEEIDPLEFWCLRMGNVFIDDAKETNALGKLSRYETALSRSLQRDLHELKHLQSDRIAKKSHPPVAVDVTVDGPLSQTGNEP